MTKPPCWTPPVVMTNARILVALDDWMWMHAAKGTYLKPAVLVAREQFLDRFQMGSDA